jgi:1-deoxy-D-xylulose-5-phosphate reductoisomerase
MPKKKKIVLLGATGSIGDSTLKVLRGNTDRLELVGIAGHSRYEKLAAIAHEFGVTDVTIFDQTACEQAEKEKVFAPGTRLRHGLEGLTALATLPEAEMVVVAVVGTLGLQPTLAAIEHGKSIALASKEILVMAGRFVMDAARRKGVAIVPLDSEHNAIFQCLHGERPEDVDRLILTASGGQFRDYTPEQMQGITREEALKHPNWDMGPKVTVDSSTMANKGLEVIEARWLFDILADRIDVVVHPQSIVHSMVQFVDGSILAQLSPPSMTFAIQHSILYPERACGVHPTLDFSTLMRLDFRPPDTARFPCLRLAFEALRAEGCAPAIFNAANEIAVAAFLDNRLPYLGIPKVIGTTLDRLGPGSPGNLEDVLATDAEARKVADSIVNHHG